MTADILNLTHLGKQSVIENDPDKVVLDRIDNPSPGFYYCCRFTVPEMTSLCPQTGQPDFATLVIDYVPVKYLVESKSLKLYLFSFRNHGSFHEKCTMDIGKRLVETLNPAWFRITGLWNGRGGISIDVTWEYGILPENVKPLPINFKMYNNGHY